jgi:hypothetical protein
METVVERPGALDVHKAQVTACVRVPAAHGNGRERHVVEFATTVAGLLTLRDWLAAHGVSQVTMEATGVFWKPVWAISPTLPENVAGDAIELDPCVLQRLVQTVGLPARSPRAHRHAAGSGGSLSFIFLSGSVLWPCS